MSEFLKGNFKVKKEVQEAAPGRSAPQSKADALKEKFKKQALASIGGSMVYVERTELTWNGDEG